MLGSNPFISYHLINLLIWEDNKTYEAVHVWSSSNPISSVFCRFVKIAMKLT